MGQARIVSCKIGPMPQGMFDPMPSVKVKYDDGAEETLFTYYPDEISFTEGEFIGKTRSEALALRTEKDIAYLQS